MKKILTIAAAFALILSVNAQKIKVINGDPSVLEGQSKLNVEYTYNHLNVGKLTEEEYIAKKQEEAEKREAGAGDAWMEAWTADRDKHNSPKFEELFNKYVEKADLVIGDFDDAEYTMIVQTDFIEPGFNVGVMRRPAYINQTVYIVKTDDKDTKLATMEILNSPGADAAGFDYDSGYRIGEAYAKAGKELGKMLYKKYLK